MFFLYDSRVEHQLDVVGFYSQSDDRVAMLADKYPDVIYFFANLTTEEVPWPLTHDAIPTPTSG